MIGMEEFELLRSNKEGPRKNPDLLKGACGVRAYVSLLGKKGGGHPWGRDAQGTRSTTGLLRSRESSSHRCRAFSARGRRHRKKRSRGEMSGKKKFQRLTREDLSIAAGKQVRSSAGCRALRQLGGTSLVRVSGFRKGRMGVRRGTHRPWGTMRPWQRKIVAQAASGGRLARREVTICNVGENADRSPEEPGLIDEENEDEKKDLGRARGGKKGRAPRRWWVKKRRGKRIGHQPPESSGCRLASSRRPKEES